MFTVQYIAVFIVIVSHCNAEPNTNSYFYLSKNMSKPEVLWNLILPGTKWCGDGDIAKDYDDLGILKETDMCCREHDHCDDYILAQTEKHGLSNKGKFTRLHCRCDRVFYKCLKRSKHYVSDAVGGLYFTGLGGKCFEEQHPAKCVSYEKIGFQNRCIEYDFDTSKPKEWQWFDVKKY